MRELKQQKNTGFTLLNPVRRERQSRYLTGFTLLEMIVAIGVFLVVVTISLSAFLNVHDIQLKMSAFRAASDNVNFAIETMVREIEEGRCTPQLGGTTLCVAGSSFSFYNRDGDKQLGYELALCGGGSGNNCIKRNDGTGAWSDITSDNINITYLDFSVSNSPPDIYDSSGWVSGDNAQPLVTITVEGEAGDKLKSKINIQASASMRQLDVVFP